MPRSRQVNHRAPTRHRHHDSSDFQQLGSCRAFQCGCREPAGLQYPLDDGDVESTADRAPVSTRRTSSGRGISCYTRHVLLSLASPADYLKQVEADVTRDAQCSQDAIQFKRPVSMWGWSFFLNTRQSFRRFLAILPRLSFPAADRRSVH
jgi:hypothetical protein